MSSCLRDASEAIVSISFLCLEILIWSIVTSHQYGLMLSLTTAWGQYTTVQISRVKKKFQLIRSLAGKSFNLISQRRRIHVPHWSMSEFRGLRDCGTGLPRLDRDSYWVHSSLGSDKGLRASDESDNGSCPWLRPIAFANEIKRRKREGGKEEYGRGHSTNVETISVHWIQLVLKGIRWWIK